MGDRLDLAHNRTVGSAGSVIHEVELLEPEFARFVSAKVSHVLTLTARRGDLVDQLIAANLRALGGLLEPDGVAGGLDAAKRQVAEHAFLPGRFSLGRRRLFRL